jgi:hypothetical protein
MYYGDSNVMQELELGDNGRGAYLVYREEAG